MTNLKCYNFIKLLSTGFFVAILFSYWGSGFVGLLVLLLPYLLIFLLASKASYNTKLKVIVRTFTALFVSVLAIALLFGFESDAQSGVAVLFVAALQYGIIFVAEAIIGLGTYGMITRNKPMNNGH